ncbi:hypothetical protein RB195_001498 [Necator americanus]|uniref:Uncharacterized protein n=1 Tax=Necator americanus TaxID=51031 RepID=A0ABR1DEK5_NECAM
MQVVVQNLSEPEDRSGNYPRQDDGRAINPEIFGLVQLVKNFNPSLSSPPVLIVVIAIVDIGMVADGFLNVNNCPISTMIPIWVIVAALSSIVEICCFSFKSHMESRNQTHPSWVRFIVGIVGVFRAGWYIPGCIWVYGVYGRVSFDSIDKENYCDQATYYIALLFSTIFSLMILLLIVCLCFIGCLVTFCEMPKQEDVMTS